MLKTARSRVGIAASILVEEIPNEQFLVCVPLGVVGCLQDVRNDSFGETDLAVLLENCLSQLFEEGPRSDPLAADPIHVFPLGYLAVRMSGMRQPGHRKAEV